MQQIKRNFFLLNRKNMRGEISVTPPISIPVDPPYMKKIKEMAEGMKRIFKNSPEAFETRALYAFNSPCNMCDYAALCYDGDTSGLVISFERRMDGKIFISPSSVITYDACPRQWAYSYLGYRNVKGSGAMEFGSTINEAIDQYILKGDDPVSVFMEMWGDEPKEHLKYAKTEPHSKLLKTGEALMEKFPEKYEAYFGEIRAFTVEIEQKIYMPITDTVILSTRPDAIFYCEEGDEDVTIIVTDFKTGATDKYNDRWIRRSDQLLLYQKAVEYDLNKDHLRKAVPSV